MRYAHISKSLGQDIYLPRRLEEKLGKILDCPCTEIVAPTGFGKTTAIREYVERLRKNDSSEIVFLFQTVLKGQEAWFWEDFAELFDELNADSVCSLLKLGIPADDSVRRTFRKIFTGMLKVIAKEIVMVIDTVSFVANESIYVFLEYFIGIIPEDFHLVIVSRQPLLSRQSLLKYYNLVNRISVKDMGFSVHDIISYYKCLGYPVSKGEAEALYSLSEGWITLVRENLNNMRTNGVWLSQKHAEKIIKEMMYDPLPEAYKILLSWVGVCNNFSVEQAEYMYQSDNTKDILTDLVEKSLFMTYNENTLEYHLDGHFASCIRRKCEELPSTEHSKRLKRAGDWCMHAFRNHAAARQYYYQAGDFDALMLAIERRTFRFPYMSDDRLFISYYADCPQEIRIRHPKGLLVFGKYFFNSNHWDLSKEIEIEFLTAVNADKQLTEDDICHYKAMYELFLGYIQYNNLKKMLLHLKKALKQLAEPDKYKWSESGMFDVPSILCIYHRKAGELEKEVRLYSKYNALYTRFTEGRTAGSELVMAAEALYMTGNITEAEIVVYKSRLAINRMRQWSVWFAAIYLQIRIEMVRGNWFQVEKYLEETKMILPEEASGGLYYSLSFMSTIDLCVAFVNCKLDQPKMLSSLFTGGWNDWFHNNHRALALICIYHMEVLLVRKDYIALLSFAESYLVTVRAFSNLLVEIFLEIDIASAYEGIGKRDIAVLHLKNALRLAEPDRMIMPFVELGRYIISILPLCATEGNDAFLKEISLRIRDYQEKLNMIRINFFSNEVNHLSQQEVRIARLAAEGYSNHEIAERMFIQECTVKTHLTHIFSKLNIEKRSQLRVFFDASKVHCSSI